jgi:hypothetical protein
MNLSKSTNNHSPLLTQNELLFSALLEFYKTNDENGQYNPQNNLDKMLKIITGESRISLRIVDWFATNFAKHNFTLYTIDHPKKGPIRFKVYDNYKLKLKAYSKKRFDPFCRWERIQMPYRDGTCIETTIGQLNFFKWAIENKVIEYIERNYTEIEIDMNTRNSTSSNKLKDTTKTRKKRKELSISATKSIKMEHVEIVLTFN